MSTTQEMDLPTSVKEKLLMIAKKLPEAKRTQFIVNTSRDIASFAGEFAKAHKYTLIYGGIGFLLGNVLDQLLTIPIVGPITFDLAGPLLGLAGAGYGFLKDDDVYRLQLIVKREIQNALK